MIMTNETLQLMYPRIRDNESISEYMQREFDELDLDDITTLTKLMVENERG